MIRSLACVLCMALGGCTFITSTSQLEERQEPLECGNVAGQSRNDLRLNLIAMNAHITNWTEVSLVQLMEGAGVRQEVGRVIWDPLGAADVQIVLPCSVTPGNHDVDFFANLDNSPVRVPGGPYTMCSDRLGRLDCPDHQWRLRLQGDGTLTYEHDTDFTNLIVNPLTRRGQHPFVATFRDMAPFASLSFEMHVRVITSGNPTILVYRRADIPDVRNDDFIAPALVNDDEVFDVAIWIDLNENGIYDPPSPGRSDRDYATIIRAITEPGPLGTRAAIEFIGANPPPPVDVRFGEPTE